MFNIEWNILDQDKTAIGELYRIIREYRSATPTAIVRILGTTKMPTKRFLAGIRDARRNSIDLIPKSDHQFIWGYLNTIIDHKYRKYRELYGRHDQKEYFDTKALFRTLTDNTYVGQIQHNGYTLHYFVMVTPNLVNKLKANLAIGRENALNHVDRHYKVCWFEAGVLGHAILYSLTCDTKEEITVGLKHYLGGKEFNRSYLQLGTWSCNQCHNVFDNDAHYAMMRGEDLNPDSVLGAINHLCNDGIECWCGANMRYNFPNKPRIVDAIFDYARQCWIRPTNLHVISDDEVGKNWDFSCPKCFGPAEMESCDAHGENHRCLNCGHQFTVK